MNETNIDFVFQIFSQNSLAHFHTPLIFPLSFLSSLSPNAVYYERTSKLSLSRFPRPLPSAVSLPARMNKKKKPRARALKDSRLSPAQSKYENLFHVAALAPDECDLNG